MVEISKCKEPCFANLHSGCKVLTVECERDACPFYKPADCTDWIRREEGGKVWLIAPEEYYAETAERW